MNRKVILGIVLVVLVVGMSRASFNASIEPSGTIYIRPDGSIDPPTAPIQRVGDVYTFTDNIDESIVVERDDIIIDGNGYTIDRRRTGYGLGLSRRNDVIVRNTRVASFEYGIDLSYSSNNVLTGNTVSDTFYVGIDLYSSANNTLTGNTLISSEWTGIDFTLSYNSTVVGNFIFDANIWGVGSHNTITANYVTGVRAGIYSGGEGNTITRNVLVACGIRLSGLDNIVVGNEIVNSSGGIYLESCYQSNIHSNTVVNSNSYGIRVDDSYNNTIYSNNFIKNIVQAEGDTLVENVWDDGGLYDCPVCKKKQPNGNYWSDYTGKDDGSRTQAHNCPNDGIGDTNPHLDKYPLMKPWMPVLGDLDYNGIVNLKDVFILSRNYGKTSQ